jgi:hypothetical protein
LFGNCIICGKNPGSMGNPCKCQQAGRIEYKEPPTVNWQILDVLKDIRELLTEIKGRL